MNIKKKISIMYVAKITLVTLTVLLYTMRIFCETDKETTLQNLGKPFRYYDTEKLDILIYKATEIQKDYAKHDVGEQVEFRIIEFEKNGMLKKQEFITNAENERLHKRYENYLKDIIEEQPKKKTEKDTKKYKNLLDLNNYETKAEICVYNRQDAYEFYVYGMTIKDILSDHNKFRLTVQSLGEYKELTQFPLIAIVSVDLSVVEKIENRKGIDATITQKSGYQWKVLLPYPIDIANIRKGYDKRGYYYQWVLPKANYSEEVYRKHGEAFNKFREKMNKYELDNYRIWGLPVKKTETGEYGFELFAAPRVRDYGYVLGEFKEYLDSVQNKPPELKIRAIDLPQKQQYFITFYGAKDYDLKIGRWMVEDNIMLSKYPLALQLIITYTPSDISSTQNRESLRKTMQRSLILFYPVDPESKFTYQETKDGSELNVFVPYKEVDREEAKNFLEQVTTYLAEDMPKSRYWACLMPVRLSQDMIYNDNRIKYIPALSLKEWSLKYLSKYKDLPAE